MWFLWLYPIIFFFLQEVHARVTIGHNTCGQYSEDVALALNEVAAVATLAYRRQTGLEYGTLNAPNMRVTMYK